MIDDPDRWAPGVRRGRRASRHLPRRGRRRRPVRLARELRSAGRPRRDGAQARRPPFAPYEDLLPELDMVLVMTVEPGFGGQSFMDEQMPKIRRGARGGRRRHGGEIWVQVDGGVSPDTIEQCAEAGADVFVAGSAVYGADDAGAAVDELRGRPTAAGVTATRREDRHPDRRLSARVWQAGGATSKQRSRAPGSVKFRTGGDSPRPGRSQRPVDLVELQDRR